MPTRDRLRLVDDVRRSLADAILAGELRPGARLLVTQTAARLDVSQSTVREAFLMLERQGLVDTRPRRGTFVTRISSRDAQELCQTRALLEAFALTVGRTHIDDTVLTRLQSQVDAMRRCRLPRDLPRLIECDLAFHQAIIELSAMPRLVELWTTLNGRIGAIILRSVEEQELRIDDVVALHAELLATLHQGDVAAMQQAVVHHYVRTEGELAALPEHTGQVAAAAVLSHRPDRASALSIAV